METNFSFLSVTLVLLCTGKIGVLYKQKRLLRRVRDGPKSAALGYCQSPWGPT